MIATLPRPAWLRTATVLYVAAFLIFLFVPLVVVAVFAFNDANYPAPPWHGFTLDWFFGSAATGRVGLFHDPDLLGSIWTSVTVAVTAWRRHLVHLGVKRLWATRPAAANPPVSLS